MSPDPFFKSRVLRPGHSQADCQTSCSWLGKGAFCGACIHPVCLRISADGTGRVSLSTSPEAWFATLAGLGEMLHLSRNPVAMLGQIGDVPTLTNWSNPVLPRDQVSLAITAGDKRLESRGREILSAAWDQNRV